MKFSKVLFYITGSVLIVGACTKKLELEPKDALTTEQALSTVGGAQAASVGMYASLRSVNYYGRSLPIYGDLSGDDVYLARTNSNRYISTFRRSYASNDADILAMWTAMYATISRANNIINAIDGISATKEEKDVLKGEALFIRALAYFDLARVFAKPYNQGGGSQPGVPIVLSSDVNGTPARNTVGEVYARIIEDLNNAKTLLATTTADTKVRASKYAASALLSRVYLYKGDYANVIIEANAVTAGNFTLTPASELSDFYSTTENAEEIFTVKFMSTESQGSDNIGNFYLKPGYGDVRVSPDLVAVFDAANDQRYKSFISPFSGSPTEFQNNKFAGQDGEQGLYSPKVLRLAEVILNRAEAYARSTPQQAANALASLNSVRTSRGLAALSGLSGQALIDAVMEERRRELAFEGHRYFDLLRTGQAVVRNYCNQPTEITTTQCTFSATDSKAIAPIPQAELDANSGITGQQNPGY